MERMVRLWIPLHALLLIAAYMALVQLSSLNWGTVQGLWFFFPIGIVGAIIANATGTGSGVVFVPVFSALEGGQIPIPAELVALASLTPEEAIGVSFIIQCFGMSVGALSWAQSIFLTKTLPWKEQVSHQTLLSLTLAPLATAIPALLLTQQLVQIDGKQILVYFKVFSLILGLVLLVFTWAQRRQPASQRRLIVVPRDLRALLLLGAVGGAVTALFSVGIGEFLAIYLILRRYPTRVAIAVAVWVSVVCVMIGVWDSALAGNIRLEVALIAIPGAILGGLAAKHIAKFLGTLWLKTFASIWIIVSSCYLLLT